MTAATAPGAYAGYVFDLDGTVYLDDELLPGAQKLLRSAFLSGATAALRLLEEGNYSLTALRIELGLRLRPYAPDERTQ